MLLKILKRHCCYTLKTLNTLKFAKREANELLTFCQCQEFFFYSALCLNYKTLFEGTGTKKNKQIPFLQFSRVIDGKKKTKTMVGRYFR